MINIISFLSIEQNTTDSFSDLDMVFLQGVNNSDDK